MQLTRLFINALKRSQVHTGTSLPAGFALSQRCFLLSDQTDSLHKTSLIASSKGYFPPCDFLNQKRICSSLESVQELTSNTQLVPSVLPQSQLQLNNAGKHELETRAADDKNSKDVRIVVKAYHLGSDINVKEIAKEHPTAQRLSSHDHCILWTPELHESTVIVDPGKDTVTLPRRCLVVYNFGSVVFFGLGLDDQRLWIDNIGRHVGDAVEESKVKTEETVIVVRPSQPQWFEKGDDVFCVRSLDIATTRVMATVLGQSVALETYISKVDAALASTVDILGRMAHSGSSRHMESQALFRLLAQNNLLYTTVITKLGVLDYSPIAWRKDRYFQVWTEFMEEYEIAHRVDALERKLVPIQENVKFILQVQHTKKTERSEVMIILLIAVEILLTVVHIWLDKFGA